MGGSVAAAVRRHIEGLRPGTVFTPAELVRDRLGSEAAVRQALRRLAAAGAIRRLSKGYYDLPRVNARIGPLSPTPEAIIAAHERKTGSVVERPTIEAANKLGLTTQVVARPVYRTNASSRDLHIGGQSITLRNAGPRSLASADDDPAELIVDALRAIGRANVTEADVSKLRTFARAHGLADALRRRAVRASSWMLPFIDSILAGSEETDG